jgi:hypothetical protein
MSKSISTSKPKTKFRFGHRNFDEISIEIRQNFDFIQNKQSKSKPKSEIQFPHRNQNFDEIRIKFCPNLDFVESKKLLRNPNKYTYNASEPKLQLNRPVGLTVQPYYRYVAKFTGYNSLLFLHI